MSINHMIYVYLGLHLVELQSECLVLKQVATFDVFHATAWRLSQYQCKQIQQMREVIFLRLGI